MNTIDKLGKFLRNDFFVDKATTKELLRTECGLRVTQDTNIVCQIKKGQVDRM